MTEFAQRPRPQLGMLALGLSDAIAHRVDQQIKRAFRHTYNAEYGLRTLVRLGIASMARSGATPRQMRDAFATLVDRNAGASKDSLLTGKSYATTLKTLTAKWCDEECGALAVETTE